MSTKGKEEEGNSAASRDTTKCEECQCAEATVYCTACPCFLCSGCDSKVHTASSKVLSRHTRVELGEGLRARAAEEEKALCAALERVEAASEAAGEDVERRAAEVSGMERAFFAKKQQAEAVAAHLRKRLGVVKAYLGGEKGAEKESVEEYVRGMEECGVEKAVKEAEEAAMGMEGLMREGEGGKEGSVPTELEFEGHWEQKEGKVSGDLVWKYKGTNTNTDTDTEGEKEEEREEEEGEGVVFRVEVRCAEKGRKRTVAYHETTDTALHLCGLTPQAAYRFRVQARNTSNSTSTSTEWSGWSETLATKAPSLPCVEGVSVAGLESGAPVVTWTPVDGKALYRVEAKEVKGGGGEEEEGEEYRLVGVVSVPRCELCGIRKQQKKEEEGTKKVMVRVCPVLVGSPSQPVTYVMHAAVSERQQKQEAITEKQETKEATTHTAAICCCRKEQPEARVVVAEQCGAAPQTHPNPAEETAAVTTTATTATTECTKKKEVQTQTQPQPQPQPTLFATEAKTEKPQTTPTTPSATQTPPQATKAKEVGGGDKDKDKEGKGKGESVSAPQGLKVVMPLCRGLYLSWTHKGAAQSFFLLKSLYIYVLEVKVKGEPDSAYGVAYAGGSTRAVARNLMSGTTYEMRVCAIKVKEDDKEDKDDEDDEDEDEDEDDEEDYEEDEEDDMERSEWSEVLEVKYEATGLHYFNTCRCGHEFCGKWDGWRYPTGRRMWPCGETPDCGCKSGYDAGCCKCRTPTTRRCTLCGEAEKRFPLYGIYPGTHLPISDNK